MHDGNGNDQKAGGDSDLFPADLLSKDTPKRVQKFLHSSSRLGANSIKAD
jgi:hypothetical protein